MRVGGVGLLRGLLCDGAIRDDDVDLGFGQAGDLQSTLEVGELVLRDARQGRADALELDGGDRRVGGGVQIRLEGGGGLAQAGGEGGALLGAQLGVELPIVELCQELHARRLPDGVPVRVIGGPVRVHEREVAVGGRASDVVPCLVVDAVDLRVGLIVLRAHGGGERGERGFRRGDLLVDGRHEGERRSERLLPQLLDLAPFCDRPCVRAASVLEDVFHGGAGTNHITHSQPSFRVVAARMRRCPPRRSSRSSCSSPARIRSPRPPAKQKSRTMSTRESLLFGGAPDLSSPRSLLTASPHPPTPERSPGGPWNESGGRLPWTQRQARGRRTIDAAKRPQAREELCRAPQVCPFLRCRWWGVSRRSR